MEANRRSAFSVRRGFLLVLVFAFIFVLGVIAVAITLYAGHWLTMEDFDQIAPTRSFANQVYYRVAKNIVEDINTPSALYRWRSTGYLDEELTFSQSAVFWFMYNSSDSTYTFNFLDSAVAFTPGAQGEWKNKLTPVIVPMLRESRAGFIRQTIEDSSGEFYFDGKIYPEEPRFVGMIADLEHFRRVEIPLILEETRKRFSLLDGFAVGPGEARVGHSQIFILVRDWENNILAQIGEPGDYLHQDKVEFPGYRKSYPFKNLSLTVDVVIPRCAELVWLWYIQRGFLGLVALWVLAMILWGWAEIRLRKLRS